MEAGTTHVHASTVNNVAIVVHQDVDGHWMVTWLDLDRSARRKGATIHERDLPGDLRTAEQLTAWAIKQPFANRNVGPWSTALRVDARPFRLGGGDTVGLALLGILLTLASTVAFGVGTPVGTACGLWVGVRAGVVASVGVSLSLVAINRSRRLHPRMTRLVRKIAGPPYKPPS